MGNIVVLDHYPLHPGSCRCCGAARVGPVVDTGFDFPDFQYEGRTYLCGSCLDDMYSKLTAYREGRGEKPGFVLASSLDAAYAELDLLATENRDLRAAIERAIPDLLALPHLLGASVPLKRPRETEPPGVEASADKPTEPEPAKRRREVA